MEQANDTPQRWRIEFDKQATDDTMAAVLKYTASISRQVEAHTRRRDPMSIDDRVQAAIVGTLAGRITWDPSRIDLARHLMGAIKTAITHELRHRRKFPQVSIDDESTNGDRLDEEMSDALAAQRESPDDESIAARFAETLAQLRILAGGDEGVLLLIEAYGSGYTEKPDVMQVTGMSSRTYHNARQRLVRLARKLPIEVRTTPLQPNA